MNKISCFFRRLFLLISLTTCIFFSANNFALAAPIKLPGWEQSRLFRTNVLGFTALPLSSQFSSKFSQCKEIEKFPPIKGDKNLKYLNFPASTSSHEAKVFFNQGMTLFYSFNDEDAIRSFKRATEIDPKFAMAYYGMALAAGSNINIAVDKPCLKFARKNIHLAQDLLKEKADHDVEKELVETLVIRYKFNDKETQNEKYAISMKTVYKKHSEDSNIAVLYADSLMNLHPWQLWHPDGKPAQEETETIVKVLKTSLKKDKEHLGLNHYYIHAMEAYNIPDEALPSADTITTLVPNVGFAHINHMPSHPYIYARMGYYEKSVMANKNAVNADRSYVKNCKDLSSNKCVQLYTGHYNTHNLSFTAISYAMIGKFNKAYEWAEKTTNFVKPFLKNQPGLIHYLPSDILMLERFGRWHDILDYKMRPRVTSPPPVQAIWHWSRAMAYLGENKVSAAKKERHKFTKPTKFVENNCKSVIRISPYWCNWGNNQTKDILRIPALVLDAKIAALENKPAEVIHKLDDAVLKQDQLVYDEPIPWTPVREALGAAYYQNGHYRNAEEVFKQDSGNTYRTSNHCNARSLFGLYNALDKQGKSEEARKVEKEFKAIWKGGDLKMSDLF